MEEKIMTVKDARKRLNEAIKKLNEIQDSLVFEIVETDYSIGFTNHGRLDSNGSFGSYEHSSFFDEYKKKLDAYTNTVMFAELIIAASKLNDPKSYHYLRNH